MPRKRHSSQINSPFTPAKSLILDEHRLAAPLVLRKDGAMTRLALAALPLIALATPLPAAASEMNDTVATLNDPIAQERMAETIRSEEHTSELQSLMRISYAVFCLKKKINTQEKHKNQLSSKIHTHSPY